jgi:acetylornithine deacetylase/succinyl-diaminopimelate desuccinylase-like protein
MNELRILRSIPTVLLLIAYVCAPLRAAEDRATANLLSELIRIDTSNPPGQEGKVAELLATKLRPLGFQIDIVQTPEPGKAHFIARLKGDGSKRPILLAAHADVVGVEREKWSVDPFAGITKDGYVYGRGALDYKGGLAVFTQAVIMLAKNKVPLARDVILLSEADEEGGRYNTLWLADNHWDKIDCEFSLNEGGWIMKNADGKVRYISITTADKSSVSLLLTAHGTSTHSSMPLPDNAIFTLAHALSKISNYETKPQLTDSTRIFYSTLGHTSPAPLSAYFNDLLNSKDPAAVARADKEISKDPLLHAIMRNTIAPVLLNGGFRGNVIPGSAEATINFRTIPGTDPQALIREMREVIQDPQVEVTLATGRGMPGAQQALARYTQLSSRIKESPTESELYLTLAAEAEAEFHAPVTPLLFQAGTDAFAWRSRGIPVYGIYPYPLDSDDLSRMHGNDERMSVKSLEQGTEVIYRTLVRVAGKQGGNSRSAHGVQGSDRTQHRGVSQ